MKPLHLTTIVVGLFVPFLLTAQSLHLTGSNPSTQSANIALNSTITFQFDQPLQPGTVSLDSIGNRFAVLPQNQITLHSLEYSPDFRSVSFTVSHQPDVDYTWVFFGLQAASGNEMTEFESVSYTTYPTVSPYSVGGQLLLEGPTPNPDFSRSVVMLLTDLSFMNEEENSGPQNAMRFVTAPDPVTGQYAITGVRPGSYYVMAMMFPSLSATMEPDKIGILSDAGGEPIQLVVSDISHSGLDLVMKPVNIGSNNTVDASVAYQLARAYMAGTHPNTRPLVIEGRNGMMPANGEAEMWFFVFLSDADSILTMFNSDGTQIMDLQTMHYLDIPENERLDADITTIKSIPELIVPSQLAFSVASSNGLGSLLQSISDNGQTHVELQFRLSHFYFEYPEFLTVDSNPYWMVELYTSDPFGLRKVSYLIDAQTAEYIGQKEVSETWNHMGLELVSSNPTHLSANIPTSTTLEFTFSEPISPNTFAIDTQDQYWSVLPSGKISIHQITYSEDVRTVFLTVTHEADTDFTWSFLGLRSAMGNPMTKAHVVQYTTKSAVSPIEVYGILEWPVMEAIPQPGQVTVITVLMDNPDYYLSNLDAGAPGVVNAGTLLSDTWEYRIQNVRAGTYYPGVFVFRNMGDGIDLFAFGFLENQDGQPATITITDQNQFGVNLPIRIRSNEGEHHPVDVMLILDKVRSQVASQETGAEMILVFGREELNRPMMPNGNSYDWSLIFYEFDTDTIQMVEAGSNGIFWIDRFHSNTVAEEERIPKELVRPLPNTFIGSGQAMSAAINNGLGDLINTTPAEAWGQVKYDLSNFYFRHPDILNSDSPPFWEIQYNAEVWNMQQEMTWSREAIFLVDALTGDFIFKTETTGIEPGEQVRKVELDQNYPNPFNPKTVIRFTLDAGRQTRLAIYDILGRQVAILVEGVMPAGSHQVSFDASALPSGIYLYRLEAGGAVIQRKMTVVK